MAMNETNKSGKDDTQKTPPPGAAASAAAGASAGAAVCLLWGMSRDGSVQADLWMATNGVQPDGEDSILEAALAEDEPTEDGPEVLTAEPLDPADTNWNSVSFGLAFRIVEPLDPAEGSAPENLEVRAATGVTDQMSFAEAFAAARQETGPGGVFAWNGQVYGTFYKEEWERFTPAERSARYEQVSRYVAENPLSEPNAPTEPLAPDGQSARVTEVEHTKPGAEPLYGPSPATDNSGDFDNNADVSDWI